MTISSSDALPARSPTPLIVHSTCRAPAVTAASVGDGQAEIVATCVLNVAFVAFGPRQNGREERADLVRDGKADGIRQIDGGAPGGDDRLDNPAQNSMRCASRPRPKTARRRYCLACLIALTAASRQVSFDIRSLRSRCRSEVAMKVRMRRRGAGVNAQPARSMSAG